MCVGLFVFLCICVYEFKRKGKQVSKILTCTDTSKNVFFQRDFFRQKESDGSDKWVVPQGTDIGEKIYMGGGEEERTFTVRYVWLQQVSPCFDSTRLISSAMGHGLSVNTFNVPHEP